MLTLCYLVWIVTSPDGLWRVKSFLVRFPFWLSLSTVPSISMTFGTVGSMAEKCGERASARVSDGDFPKISETAIGVFLLTNKTCCLSDSLHASESASIFSPSTVLSLRPSLRLRRGAGSDSRKTAVNASPPCLTDLRSPSYDVTLVKTEERV